MPEVRDRDTVNEPFPIIPLAEVKYLKNKRKIRIIVASDECVQNQIMGMFKALGISKLFFLSNENRKLIVKKMTPWKLTNFRFEISLADHCNLNCQCCDHFSPIAEETYLDFEQYVNDMHRLAELTGGQIGAIRLEGGEPLLNNRVIDYMRVARECFPESRICVITNGLLLPKWGGAQEEKDNLWVAVKNYEIELWMTQYPIPMQIDKIVEQAQKYDIPVTYESHEFEKGARLWIFTNLGNLNNKGEKHSIKHPFDLSGQQEKYRWISCHQFNECIGLKNGKIYTCPIVAHAHHFNKAFHQNLEVREDCYIDIYKADSFEEIAEFCTHRISFCDYCAVHMRSTRAWKQSEHSMEEWVL